LSTRVFYSINQFMNSPLYPDTPMQSKELEPGLTVFECPKSGGLWIPLQAYLSWKEKQPEIPIPASDDHAPAQTDEPKQKALLCPESGRVLLRYRVGHGLPFLIARSPATGGVWLERGEWEALKSKGLHVSLHLICTAGYQRQIRSAVYTQTLTDTFRDRIGAEDFAKVNEFATWLTHHPKGRDICCYLTDQLEQKTQPELPDTAQPEIRQSVERDKPGIACQPEAQSNDSEPQGSLLSTQDSANIAASNTHGPNRKLKTLIRIFDGLAIASIALYLAWMAYDTYAFKTSTKPSVQLSYLERDPHDSTHQARLGFQLIGRAGLAASIVLGIVSGVLRARNK
jgi:hypothetical protein